MLLSIFFAKTNSKNYQKTLAIARCIPFAEMKEGTGVIPFLTEKDCCIVLRNICIVANAFHRLWVTHSLFVGKNFYEKRVILFLGGTQNGSN